jgi:hypothetical protein
MDTSMDMDKDIEVRYMVSAAGVLDTWLRPRTDA